MSKIIKVKQNVFTLSNCDIYVAEGIIFLSFSEAFWLVDELELVNGCGLVHGVELVDDLELVNDVAQTSEVLHSHILAKLRMPRLCGR